MASEVLSKETTFTSGNPMSSAPKDRKILAWWPLLKLPDDLDAVPTEIVDDEYWGNWSVTEWAGGCWDDQDFCEATGGYFGDEYEYAPEPLYWWPMPPEPIKPPERNLEVLKARGGSSNEGE